MLRGFPPSKPIFLRSFLFFPPLFLQRLPPPWPHHFTCWLNTQQGKKQPPESTETCWGEHGDPVPTLTNILLPAELWPGLVGVQYTDMDLRSRENSRVHSFLISCLITCGDRVGLSQGGWGAATKQRGGGPSPPTRWKIPHPGGSSRSAR